jgi:hypothetical protein
VPSHQSAAPAASWLFIKDNQSIWVERPHGRLLVVAGPGAQHAQRDFISEEALNEFQIALAERLAGDGWFLWGVNRERRQGERRQAARGTPDRRAGERKAEGLRPKA